MKTYTCWLSHTCFVCRDSLTVHVTEEDYRPTSPCDLAPVVIKAPDRRTARRHFVQRPLVRRMLAG